ncbi:uncharacterized protein LOC133821935 [Humulus lupulus]|uniref:uncharacterized protein LOC133821935 n=1 Tax=Humulus lupulus TaxID=3486 RepID=UPI002B40DBA7|nr:uncharacterized protein LOC133821935 [Humulus lupulus]
MVCVRERDSERVLKSSSSSVSMALGPERTKPLHNFDLPCLKWGSQKYLRCMREVSNGGAGGRSDRRSDVTRFQSSLGNRRRESEPERRKFRAPKPVFLDNDGKEGIAAMGEKILLEIKTVSEKLKDKFLAEGDAEAEKQSAAMPPRKLRARKVPSAQEVEEAGKCSGIEEMKANCSPLRSEANNGVKLTRLVRGLPPPENKERVKFSVPLSKKEIEEDFMELFGHKPPRRPKKRPRNVQRQLDYLFPGLYLNEITTDTYKVPDDPETGKR